MYKGQRSTLGDVFNQRRARNKMPYFGAKNISLELSPHRHIDIKKVNQLSPAFCSVVWDEKTKFVSLMVAMSLRKRHKIVLHLAGKYWTKANLPSYLSLARSAGVRYIFAIAGDSSHSESHNTDFPFAADLVEFLSNFRNLFTVGVAGYPDTHPLSENSHTDLTYLHQKIDAGANFIITQAFLDYDTFKNFYASCRNYGITVTIIPGLYLFGSYQDLISMAQYCQFTIPDFVLKIVEENKHNPSAVRSFSLHYMSELIKKIFLSNDFHIDGVHFFSLNKFAIIEEMYHRLGFYNTIERPL